MSQDDHNPTLDDSLLDYHMGWLDARQAAEVDGLVESAPEVSAQSEMLRRCIEPLADWTALPACDGLEEQTLARVRRDVQDRIGLRRKGRGFFPGFWGKLSPVENEPLKMGGFLVSPREAAAMAACVVVLAGVWWGWSGWFGAVARREACAANLQTIASGLAAYNRDFGSWMPFAAPRISGGPANPVAASGGNWLREHTTGVGRIKNSRNRFLLAAQGYVGDTAAFLCPADPTALVMRVDDIRRFDDFAERRNCSYDSQIVSAQAPLVTNDPRLVVYADSNPLFENRRNSPNPADGNSPRHRNDSGQNVMRQDGSVAWATSPRAGVENDNIWQIGERLSYTGNELPQLATDSFMVP